MDLNKIYSDTRLSSPGPRSLDPRSNFQRDFDRIIFSSAFRRLQNKTQVFPLPGSVFVHNRLTHSLEVASVGRSLGNLVGNHVASTYKKDISAPTYDFFKYSLDSVISAAALCHDIGNPAFGHSGEDAIASYFVKNEGHLKAQFSDAEWKDFINFEGNANAIRILTQQQNGKSGGSFNLTASTLAAIAKYPCEAAGKIKGIIHRKKFGFLQSEKEVFEQVASNTGMIPEQVDPVIYKRHPFVWLVEAADDICYHIIDLEDAHRLSIIEHGECVQLLVSLIEGIGTDDIHKLKSTVDSITNKNEKIGYLRARSINALIMQVYNIYTSDFEQIVAGEYDAALFDQVMNGCQALKDIQKFSIRYIYNHRSVVEIENAGYNVMSELLSHFIPPVLAASPVKSQEKAVKLIPEQFRYESGSNYEKVMGIIDYVSGMTDNYAIDLYRKIKGIEIGMTT